MNYLSGNIWLEENASTIHEPIDLSLEQDTDKSGELILCNIIIIL